MKIDNILLRVILVSIFCLLLLTSAFIYAADNPLQRSISIEASNQPLEEVLQRVASSGGFLLSYNPDWIPTDSIVTLNVRNSKVSKVLSTLLGKQYKFRNSGRHIIILRATKAPKQDRKNKNISYSIRGVVRDKASGVVLKDVVVYDVVDLQSALSDQNGNFSIEISQKRSSAGVRFSKSDYYDTIIVVNPEVKEVAIQLEPEKELDPASLQPIKTIEIADVNEVNFVQKVVPQRQYQRASNQRLIEKRIGQISFLPRLGTNYKMSGVVSNKISINVLGGYSAGVEWVEIGGLFNIDRYYVRGFQIAGLNNIVSGEVSGFQVAGIWNNNQGKLKGVQVAGIFNHVRDTITGVQIAGISNTLKGAMRGLQLAGINNHSTQNVEGAQIAGIVNSCGNDVKTFQLAGITNVGNNVGGIQIAGLVNASRGDVGGGQLAGLVNTSRKTNLVQLAGLSNFSKEEVNGLQFTSVLNIANKVNGFQLGVFNAADTVSGAAIGFFSFVNKGMHQLELQYNDVLYAGAYFKTGTFKFYNIFYGGANPNEEELWGAGYGIGRSSEMSRNWRFNYELMGIQVQEKGTDQVNVNARFNFLFYKYFTKKFRFYFGPSLVAHVSSWKDPETGEFLTNIAPYTIWEEQFTHTQVQFWFGWNAGFSFL